MVTKHSKVLREAAKVKTLASSALPGAVLGGGAWRNSNGN